MPYHNRNYSGFSKWNFWLKSNFSFIVIKTEWHINALKQFLFNYLVTKLHFEEGEVREKKSLSTTPSKYTYDSTRGGKFYDTFACRPILFNW